MKRDQVLLITFSLFLVVFLILFSYKLVFYFSEYNEDQREAIAFLNGEKELSGDYTSEERSHLEDVKGVMSVLDYLFYVGLVISVGLLIYDKGKKKRLGDLLFYGGLTGFGFILVLFLFGLISFNFLFKIFHELFFPQGNWIFPTESLLIQTFPQEFFERMAIKIIGLSLFLASIFIGLSFIFKKRW